MTPRSNAAYQAVGDRHPPAIRELVEALCSQGRPILPTTARNGSSRRRLRLASTNSGSREGRCAPPSRPTNHRWCRLRAERKVGSARLVSSHRSTRSGNNVPERVCTLREPFAQGSLCFVPKLSGTPGWCQEGEEARGDSRCHWLRRGQRADHQTSPYGLGAGGGRGGSLRGTCRRPSSVRTSAKTAPPFSYVIASKAFLDVVVACHGLDRCCARWSGCLAASHDVRTRGSPGRHGIRGEVPARSCCPSKWRMLR